MLCVRYIVYIVAEWLSDAARSRGFARQTSESQRGADVLGCTSTRPSTRAHSSAAASAREDSCPPEGNLEW